MYNLAAAKKENTVLHDFSVYLLFLTLNLKKVQTLTHHLGSLYVCLFPYLYY